jgi:hypothetical protein
MTASVALAALPFSLGLKGGLNLASASYDPDVQSPLKTSGRTGFAIGAVAELGVGGPIFIALEPMFVQKGSVISGGPVVVNTGTQIVQIDNLKVTQKVGFLELPLLLKAKLIKSNIHPYGFVGPAIGITLSSTTTTEATGFTTQDQDTKSEVSSTDFSIVVGAGAEFELNKHVKLTFDGRYALGLSDVAKEPAGAQGDQKVKTRGIQFFVGALFGV